MFKRTNILLAALLVACHGGLVIAADPPAEKDAEPTAAIGRLVRLPLPIVGRVDDQVKRSIHRTLARLREKRTDPSEPVVLILEFSPGQSQSGGGSDFSRALSLARFLTNKELKDVKTVAYIPRPIEGHALLVAMACDEIVMGPDATLGEAGVDEDPQAPIEETIAAGYDQIAARRRTIDPVLARGLLDRKQEVFRVETDKGAQFVLQQDLEKLQQERTFQGKPQVVFASGEKRQMSAREARDLGVARYLADSRMSVAKALGLPASAMEVDPEVEGKLQAITIAVTGKLDARLAETRKLMIKEALDDPAINMICLRIDSPGGDAKAALDLASYVSGLSPARVLTVAYVPHEALGVAALVALSCDQLVMQRTARIGGGDRLPNDQDLLEIAAALANRRLPERGRTWSLPLALMDRNMVVHEYTNVKTGVHEYFSVKELEEQPDQEDWQRGPQVTLDGLALQLSADDAQTYGLVRDDGVVDDFEKLKTLFGLESDPTFAEPGWTEALVRILTSRGVSILLVMFGLAGMYIELKTPGLGIGGFVAAVSFMLFFWANYLEHTANVLEMVLFVMGVAFLLLEVFVLPGFGIFGLGGGLLVITSLVLASQTFILPRSPSQFAELRDSLLVVCGAGVGMVALALLLQRYLPRSRFLQPMVLTAPEGDQAELSVRESLADYRHLLRAQGTTLTPLTPAGKVRFGDEVVDVISDGQWISPGSTVTVVAVRGSRVEVAEA